jgi:hypothetical protein
VLLAKLPPFFIYRPATNSRRFAKKKSCLHFWAGVHPKMEKKRLEIAKIRYLTPPTSGKNPSSTSMDAARTPSVVAVEYEVPGPARTLSTAVDAAMVDEEQPPANGRTPSVMPGRTLSGI